MASGTGTATTRALRAIDTARIGARPTGCQPINSTRPSSTRFLLTYENHDLVETALREAHARACAARPQLSDQLAATETEIRKTEEAMERYFLAFEAGTMPEEQCAQRLQTLGQQMPNLGAGATRSSSS